MCEQPEKLQLQQVLSRCKRHFALGRRFNARYERGKREKCCYIGQQRGLSAGRRLSGHEEIEEIEETVTDTSEGPEQQAIRSEENRIILEEIKKLGEPDSQILYRRYFLAQPVKDIAESLGMKSNSVTKRLSRALKVLKDRLEGKYEG